MTEFSGSFKKGPNSVKKVGITSVGSITGGNEGTIARTNITLERKGKRRNVPGPMIIKDLGGYSPFNNPAMYGENVLIKHRWLKEHGFPVVPTLRYDPERKIFLMTDVTLGGIKRIIDKHHPIHWTDKLAPYIKTFRGVAKGIAQDAYADGNGVFLSSDSYAILVDHLERGELCLLDIGLNSYPISNHKDIIGNTDRRFSVTDAINNVDTFYRDIFS